MGDSPIREHPEGTSAPRQGWRVALALVAFGFALSVVIILVFAVQNSAQVKARSAILAELDQLRGDYHVRLNNRDVDDGALLIASIRRMRQVSAHHSHPTASIHVEVRDSQRAVAFVIARDSELPDEYWVFRPGENLQGDPRGQEAGRVFDGQLSNYLRRWGF